jgi:hypothetical protein
MSDPRNAEYQRRWRERKAGRLPPLPVCTACRRRFAQPNPLSSKNIVVVTI